MQRYFRCAQYTSTGHFCAFQAESSSCSHIVTWHSFGGSSQAHAGDAKDSFSTEAATHAAYAEQSAFQQNDSDASDLNIGLLKKVSFKSDRRYGNVLE